MVLLPLGELYALKRYKNNRLNGHQEYYYRNGLPKSVFEYNEGLIDHDALLFHVNGKVKREMHFKNGKRNGKERMWNDDGMLTIEANYKNDVPIGTAREWYSNGNLAKEMIYEEGSDVFHVKQWQETACPFGKKNPPVRIILIWSPLIPKH